MAWGTYNQPCLVLWEESGPEVTGQNLGEAKVASGACSPQARPNNDGQKIYAVTVSAQEVPCPAIAPLQSDIILPLHLEVQDSHDG